MSKNDQEWFIGERSKALALMHLTRRKDLFVMTPGGDVGLEFIVSIAKEDGERSLRQFGVLLRGTKSPVKEEELNETLRPTLQSLQRLGQFPDPVCLLYFTMDDDQGYVTWVAEPKVVDNTPRLLMHGDAHCRKLNRALLDEIVSLVDRWYDAFFARIAVKAS
jgi:hypothetical protein